MAGTEIWILGAGGHAKVAMSAALASGMLVTGVFADQFTDGSMHLGLPVRIPIPLDWEEVAAHLAIGANLARARLSRERPGWRWATILHPTAYLDPRAEINDGALVCAGACIQVDAVVGRHAIINTQASIDHDCVIGDFAHIAPGVALCGAVTVEEGGFVGVGSSVAPGSRSAPGPWWGPVRWFFATCPPGPPWSAIRRALCPDGLRARRRPGRLSHQPGTRNSLAAS